MDFGNMTLNEMIANLPAQFDLLRSTVPIEKRHEFNVVEQKVKKAIAAGDMNAILELQKQYGVYSNPASK